MTEHVRKRAIEITDNHDLIEEQSRIFFSENMSPNDPIPSDIPINGESYVSRRNIQWERQIDVTYDGDTVRISFRRDNENSVPE